MCLPGWPRVYEPGLGSGAGRVYSFKSRSSWAVPWTRTTSKRSTSSRASISLGSFTNK
jgi:hypothetical protein